MDLSEAAKDGATALGAVASFIAGVVGVRTLLEKHRAAQKEFRDSLATKEQVEKHKRENEEHIERLNTELNRRLDAQDRNIRHLQDTVQDMPLRIVEALKQ